MSKIVIITVNNLYLTPYINNYTKHIATDFDIIYWNRDEITESSSAKNVFGFIGYINPKQSKLKKIVMYLKFRKYVKKILKSNKYEKIIFLNTMSAVLIGKNVGAKYIVDIRDYTFEHNIFFYNIEKKVIKGSELSVISSEGYRKFLPKHEYILVHNSQQLEDLPKKTNDKGKLTEIRPIIISFVGLIRFFEISKKIIIELKNDPRFKLNFIGKGSEMLRQFCISENVTNVQLISKFESNETMRYFEECDIVYNLYGNDNPSVIYALSNKLYYAAFLNKPILVNPNTFMYDISFKYHMGISVNLDSRTIADDIYEQFINLDFSTLKKGCDDFMNHVKIDNTNFDLKVSRFIGDENEIE
ncbi:sugar transferase [Acholeplasma laidlawii]|uniref:Glycosyltransferase family 4 protein n=3 Tax=Acholeplasma laidlawii TaxID=2148 RepID=A0A553IH56_ACHLA|nr:sugar transferase [Acholeplasma laidlawii]ABX81652.1 putative sugar transferase [Acholeplasma laidlawii PG-8A]NWH09772.1 hypothetical protein [Acholeplasma laidlawii]NWH11162.1 hypothetical protein [Acholeplasma laidlawii]NWH13427.1 hypothetical protein [Acholeplasma laidlawii]NWH14024.1 hypothetical protein [Acholeplasma laidlawii]